MTQETASLESQITADAFARAEGACSISAAVKALNGVKRGGYTVKVKVDTEYNEIDVQLFENTIRNPIATGYIDRGHTPTDFKGAKAELIGLCRAYLFRE